MIDRSAVCGPGESVRCFTERESIVVASDGSALRVRYDDARKTAELRLLADSRPPVGSRVRLLRWGGDEVGIYDPRSERRYGSIRWPRRWNPNAIGVTLFGGVIVAAQLARWAIRRRRGGEAAAPTPITA